MMSLDQLCYFQLDKVRWGELVYFFAELSLEGDHAM